MVSCAARWTKYFHAISAAPMEMHIVGNAIHAYGRSNGMPIRIKPSLLPGMSSVPQAIMAPPAKRFAIWEAVIRDQGGEDAGGRFSVTGSGDPGFRRCHRGVFQFAKCSVNCVPHISA